MSRVRRVSLSRVLPLAAVLAVPLLPAAPAHAGTAEPVTASPAAPAVAAAPAAATDAATRDATTDAAVLAVTASTTRAASAPLRMTARGRHAVRWAKHRHYWPTRTCMVFVRTALGVSGRYPTPRVAWSAAHHRHRTAFKRIPAGVPVYTAGRTAPGHIVLSLGHGKVRSTDWPRAGHVATVKLRKLLRSWHHHYLGWSEDLNGVRVWHR
jgi:hypothetical protein